MSEKISVKCAVCGSQVLEIEGVAVITNDVKCPRCSSMVIAVPRLMVSNGGDLSQVILSVTPKEIKYVA